MGRSLREILSVSGNDDTEDLKKLWSKTEAADEFAPIPAGVYECRVTSGELFNSRQKKTPGYQVVFAVKAGSHAGRRVFLDLWLTPAALPSSKRDLQKLGVTDPGQLERPLPQGILARVTVALRTGDDGQQRNEVKKFEVTGVEEPEAEPFSPVEAGGDIPDDSVPF